MESLVSKASHPERLEILFGVDEDDEGVIEYIKNETLTANLELADKLDSGEEINFDDVNTQLLINKH